MSSFGRYPEAPAETVSANRESRPVHISFQKQRGTNTKKPMKDSLEKIAREVRACRKCRLWKSRKKAVPGEGPKNARIFFCGQAPGTKEDEQGKPFVGRAGKFLNKLLDSVNIERENVFITSAVKCFPPHNRKPKEDESNVCSHYLDRQLVQVRPGKVVLLGEVAFHSFFPEKKLKECRGKWQVLDEMKFLPTYHPAAGMRFPRVRRAIERDFQKLKGV